MVIIKIHMQPVSTIFFLLHTAVSGALPCDVLSDDALARGKKRDSNTPEYEVKYKRSTEGVQGSTGGIQGKYRGVQGEYRGSTGGVQGEYRRSTGGVQEEYRGSTGGVQGEYRRSTGGVQGEYKCSMSEV